MLHLISFSHFKCFNALEGQWVQFSKFPDFVPVKPKVDKMLSGLFFGWYGHLLEYFQAIIGVQSRFVQAISSQIELCDKEVSFSKIFMVWYPVILYFEVANGFSVLLNTYNASLFVEKFSVVQIWVQQWVRNVVARKGKIVPKTKRKRK